MGGDSVASLDKLSQCVNSLTVMFFPFSPFRFPLLQLVTITSCSFVVHL